MSKKTLLVLGIIVSLILTMISCSSNSTEPNDPIISAIQLAYPTNNLVLPQTDEIPVAADVTNFEDLQKVIFFINEQQHFVDTSSPYSFSWSTIGLSGTYSLYVKAVDSGNTETCSDTISVTVESAEMIFVQGGTFPRGDNIGVGESDELPVHDVTVDDFYIGKYEVTQAEWESVMGSNPAENFGVGPNHPVYYVSWYSAIEYCNALSESLGLDPCYTIDGNFVSWDFTKSGYRLPTEAEWEYAAKGGVHYSDIYKYSGTTDDLGDYCWYDANAGPRAHEVGSKLPNQLGIYDMSGNIWEWCWDWYGAYSAESQTNPLGPDTGIERIRRGGNWGYDAFNCRVANRYDYDPSTSSLINGFRVTRKAE